MRNRKIAVLGCGLTGATIANILADNDCEVTIFEKEEDLGGMCADKMNENFGIIVSKYGPHIFHTNNEEVYGYISKFAEFVDYNHEVLAKTNKGLLPWPINRETICKVFDEEDFEKAKRKWDIDIQLTNLDLDRSKQKESFETVAKRKAGSRLYNLFMKKYTETQWQRKASELPAEIFGRVRFEDSNERKFFKDKYVKMPKDGFTQMIKNMVTKTNITIIKKEITRSDLIKLQLEFDNIVSTIPVDTFFNVQPLEMIKVMITNYLINKDGVMDENVKDLLNSELGVLNICNSDTTTRITNYSKLFHNEITKNNFTIIAKEKPSINGYPLYPIATKENVKRARLYVNALKYKENIISAGRLGKYKYINMDEAIADGIKTAKILLGME